jgi:hypothetical protein
MIEEFNQKKYTMVKNAVTADIIDFIHPYFLINEFKNPDSKDIQVPNAFSSYADSLTESILLKLKSTVEINTGLSLLPTYSYYRIYRSGDILFPHKDREACEISATLCLGFSYNSDEYSWPVIVEGYKYILDPGDMAIYKGIECSHWRNKFEPPNENDYHIQTFLHYVDKNGPYAEWENDKRMGIGCGRND